MNDRIISWWANRIMFDEKIEEMLAHCPNMTDEDDKRDICKEYCCPLYDRYCVSIEPSEEEME